MYSIFISFHSHMSVSKSSLVTHIGKKKWILFFCNTFEFFGFFVFYFVPNYSNCYILGYSFSLLINVCIIFFIIKVFICIHINLYAS